MFYKRYIKRLLDFIVAVIGTVILGALFIIIGIAIKLDSRGPILFLQERIGQNGKVFKIYKFRTMVSNAAELGPHFTSKDDVRITKIGKFLRKTSLDEIPQIINVLKGEMSLIGPRPYAIKQKDTVSHSNFVERHAVLPGITGLAQVKGRSSLTSEEKLNYDLIYVKEISLLLDVKILIRTVVITLKSKASW
ncbi:TPA: sugar transferase [Bacillus cereus]